jgi:hypothetical protein
MFAVSLWNGPDSRGFAFRTGPMADSSAPKRRIITPPVPLGGRPAEDGLDAPAQPAVVAVSAAEAGRPEM